MPPTFGGRQKHHLRALCRKPFVDRGLIAQIGLGAARRQQFDVFCLQPAHQRGTYHAAMPGDVDRLAFQLKRKACHWPPPAERLEIACDHFLDQLGKRRPGLPAELLARLAGVADQKIDFGRPEVHRIDVDHGLAGCFVDAGLVDAVAAPFDAAADFGKRERDEFAHRTGLAGRQHEIVGRIRLQYPVHALDIVPSVSPVALGIEVAEIERLFQAGFDAGDAARDLARHKRLAADRALMVEQDAVTGKHAIGLAVIHNDPVAVQLCDAIR